MCMAFITFISSFTLHRERVNQFVQLAVPNSSTLLMSFTQGIQETCLLKIYPPRNMYPGNVPRLFSFYGRPHKRIVYYEPLRMQLLVIFFSFPILVISKSYFICLKFILDHNFWDFFHTKGKILFI